MQSSRSPALIAAQERYYRSQKTGVLRASAIGTPPIASKRNLSPAPPYHPGTFPGPKRTLLLESVPFLLVVVVVYL